MRLITTIATKEAARSARAPLQEASMTATSLLMNLAGSTRDLSLCAMVRLTPVNGLMVNAMVSAPSSGLMVAGTRANGATIRLTDRAS